MCLLIGIISQVRDVAHGPHVFKINLKYTVYQSHDTLDHGYMAWETFVACTHFASVSIFRASTHPGYQALSEVVPVRWVCCDSESVPCQEKG